MGAKEKAKQRRVHGKSVHSGREAGKGLKERRHLSKVGKQVGAHQADRKHSYVLSN